MSALDSIAVPALPAKLMVEAALLAVSYSVQQRFLFTREPAADAGSSPAMPRPARLSIAATHIPAMVPPQSPHSLAGNRRNQSTH